MKNIYLHIGLNKVGSTTLQDFLFQNRELLLSKDCLYLKTGTPPQVIYGENHNLAWYFNKHPLFNPSFGIWSDVHQEIASTTVNNIIISSEYFSILNAKEIKELQQELTNYNTKIVVYLRRQDTRSISLYVQGVKQNNRIEPLEEVWEKLKQDCNYEKKLARWANCFGVENIIVRPLEKTQIKDIRHDFLQILGINQFNIFQYSQDKNKSPNQKLTEILRFINEILIGKIGLSEAVCFPYKETLLKQYSQKKLFINDTNNYSFLPETQYQQLLEEFSNSNSQVAKEYLKREDGILFYEKPSFTSSETITFKIEDLTETDLREIVLCLLSHNSQKDQTITGKKLNDLLNNSTLSNKDKLESFLLDLAKFNFDK